MPSVEIVAGSWPASAGLMIGSGLRFWLFAASRDWQSLLLILPKYHHEEAT